MTNTTVGTKSGGDPSPLDVVLDMQGAHESDVWVPALPTVRGQQKELTQRLRDGFDGRHDLLLWMHAVAAVSAGSVPHSWFRETVGDRWRVACCLSDAEARAHMCSVEIDDRAAAGEREDIIRDVVSPAFERGLDLLRSNAGDYTEDDDGVQHTDRQRFLGMRPRLHQVAVAQHRALLQALGHRGGGFDGRREVSDWADYTIYACSGYTPDHFIQRTTAPMGRWYPELVADGASVDIEFLLADEILPAANKALRTAVREGEEHPEELDTSPDVDPGPTEAF